MPVRYIALEHTRPVWRTMHSLPSSYIRSSCPSVQEFLTSGQAVYMDSAI